MTVNKNWEPYWYYCPKCGKHAEPYPGLEVNKSQEIPICIDCGGKTWRMPVLDKGD